MIIGSSTGARNKGEVVEICFVDCFAGPWQAPSDDLSGTSISLSLQILEDSKGSRYVPSRQRLPYMPKYAA